MNLINILNGKMERSSAGSRATSEKVISLCPKGSSALYIGDETVTPALLKAAGWSTTAAITDELRAKSAVSAGLDVLEVQRFELPQGAENYDLLWYNGVVEYDSPELRLEQLKGSCKKGGTVVYRSLCWLIDPSPDTKAYCTRRFGVIRPLDGIIRAAKDAGFSVQDLYISPRSDWTTEFYSKLTAAAQEYAGQHEGEASLTAGLSELQKEIDMFELHCEEYSYVYYILKG